MDRLLHDDDMADTWFTPDFHFRHFNITRYCNRPFKTTEEMDTCIVDRMNQCVKLNDMLYYLGDFCMGRVEKVMAHCQGQRESRPLERSNRPEGVTRSWPERWRQEAQPVRQNQ